MIARCARHITGTLDPVSPSRVTVGLFFLFQTTTGVGAADALMTSTKGANE
jgi:hypothetical protein